MSTTLYTVLAVETPLAPLYTVVEQSAENQEWGPGGAMVIPWFCQVLGALQHGGISGKSGKSGKNSRIARFWTVGIVVLRWKGFGDER